MHIWSADLLSIHQCGRDCLAVYVEHTRAGFSPHAFIMFHELGFSPVNPLAQQCMYWLFKAPVLTVKLVWARLIRPGT